MALSPTAKRAMFSQETEEVMIALLRITHPAAPSPMLVSSDPTVRVSNDPLLYGTVSRGALYYFIPFSLVLPESSDESPPAAKIVLSNIDRDLIPLLRSFHTPASVAIDLVLASQPDSLEAGLSELQIQQCIYTAEEIVLSLGAPLLATEPLPALSFTPNHFPGLFR